METTIQANHTLNLYTYFDGNLYFDKVELPRFRLSFSFFSRSSSNWADRSGCSVLFRLVSLSEFVGYRRTFAVRPQGL